MHELERRLRVTEPVIKFLTVRIDEEQKRLDKIKAIRDARSKARSRSPAAEAGGEPAAGSNGIEPAIAVSTWPLAKPWRSGS